MAGDWIPMRTDLADDPAVIAIAAATGLDESSVIGKLHRLWSWANRHTTDGNARGVTRAWLDRYVSADGFADAMVDAGWLESAHGTLTIPKFDVWNSQSAKTRVLTARRAASHRTRKSNGVSVTDALPKEEKRREESNTDTPLPPTGGKRPRSVFVPPTVEEVRQYCHQRNNGIDPEEFVAHYTACGWVQGRGGKPVKDWKACVVTWEKARAKSNGNFGNGRDGGISGHRSPARVDSGLLAQLDREVASAGHADGGSGTNATGRAGVDP